MESCTCSHGMQKHSWRNYKYMHCLVCAECGRMSDDHIYMHHKWVKCACGEYVPNSKQDNEIGENDG